MLHSASVTALIANISLSGLDPCLSDRCVDLAWIDLLSLLIICLTVLVGIAVVAVLIYRLYNSAAQYKYLNEGRRQRNDDMKSSREYEGRFNRETYESAWRCVEHYWKAAEAGNASEFDRKSASRAMEYLACAGDSLVSEVNTDEKTDSGS